MTSATDNSTPVAGRAAATTGHIPGEAGVWVFVLGDMTAFGVFFAIFMLYRSRNLELYLSSQAQLNMGFGILNTLLLLASSWCVVMAVVAARSNRLVAAPRFFQAAFLCGLGFMGVKALEWSEKLHHGIGLTRNEFFTFYYMLTGIHFLHVIVGMVVLAFLWRRSCRPLGKPLDRVLLESGATYWHMVDLLWIVLFPLFYLLK